MVVSSIHLTLSKKIENGNGEVVYEHEPNPTRVWSEAVNYILYDMLRDVTTEGTGRAALQYLDFSTDLASKRVLQMRR